MLGVYIYCFDVTNAALLSLLKFIITNEKILSPKMNLFPLATQVRETVLCCAS